MFANAFSGRRALVTGNTGFKGSWLTAWLLRLGADVTGVSKDVPTDPAMFETLVLGGRIRHVFADIRDTAAMAALVAEVDPDFVFHLAAQPIVSRSYEDPLETISTNVLGTASVLDALRLRERPCIAVLVTSDKCYQNVEWEYGYREGDRLGGKDVYSGSKAAAEAVIHSYHRSFFQTSGVRSGSARAGNVIGGGDWAKDRIVPDAVRSWRRGLPVEIRMPNATRPWQHVLEPLSGYLTMAAALHAGECDPGESFNFGPPAEQVHTVGELLSDLARAWGGPVEGESFLATGVQTFSEAGLLKLCCDKAIHRLRWRPTLEYGETVRFTSDWYREHAAGNVDMFKFTVGQIARFEDLARERGLRWATS